eukprot:scaffold8931_cov75-Isochrysis_galbana.AAC.4
MAYRDAGGRGGAAAAVKGRGAIKGAGCGGGATRSTDARGEEGTSPHRVCQQRLVPAERVLVPLEPAQSPFA